MDHRICAKARPHRSLDLRFGARRSEICATRRRAPTQILDLRGRRASADPRSAHRCGRADLRSADRTRRADQRSARPRAEADLGSAPPVHLRRSRFCAPVWPVDLRSAWPALH
ncbi:hypothetical protein Adt_39192 [Abeliophyllum distichum]|uniref:Uncharacterized protein n=1 Tax=Abeliophyllum distichum TaxID=126358 RepID=A0ABD1Q8L5_9LAMI